MKFKITIILVSFVLLTASFGYAFFDFLKSDIDNTLKIILSVLIIPSIFDVLRTSSYAVGKEIGYYDRDAWEFRSKIEQNRHMKNFPETFPVSVYIIGILSIIADFIGYSFLFHFLYNNYNSIFIFSLISVYITLKLTFKAFYMFVMFNKKGLK